MSSRWPLCSLSYSSWTHHDIGDGGDAVPFRTVAKTIGADGCGHKAGIISDLRQTITRVLLGREGSPERFCKGLASVFNKTQGNSDPEPRVTVTIYRRKQVAELGLDFLKTRIVGRQIVIHPRTCPEAG